MWAISQLGAAPLALFQHALFIQCAFMQSIRSIRIHWITHQPGCRPPSTYLPGARRPGGFCTYTVVTGAFFFLGPGPLALGRLSACMQAACTFTFKPRSRPCLKAILVRLRVHLAL